MMLRLLLVLMLFAPQVTAETLRLAATTSFQNSGLSEVLLPRIKSDTGIDVQLLVVGTGQALRLGQAGDVDALLVHAPEAERAFVADGFATHRRQIMYNDFVLVGPRDDPAQIASAQTAAAAVQKLAQSGERFVSRGDDSGTHQKERALWSAANLQPEDFGPWYSSVGAGMGASLNTAAGLDAYILVDRASWLNFSNKANLALLFEGDPALFNQYSFLPIDPARHDHVKAELSGTLERWLTSAAAQKAINSYEIRGMRLFHFNASSN